VPAVELPAGFDQGSLYVFFSHFHTTALLTWRRRECAPSSKAWAKKALIVQYVAQNGGVKRPEASNEGLRYTRSDRRRRYARGCIAPRFVSLYRCLKLARQTKARGAL